MARSRAASAAPQVLSRCLDRAGTGQGPFDVVLSAVLDAAQDKQGTPAGFALLSAEARPALGHSCIAPAGPGPPLR